ncbi:MAG: hypothetical protein HEQ23_06510 [Tepidisphaera sp.]
MKHAAVLVTFLGLAASALAQSQPDPKAAPAAPAAAEPAKAAEPARSTTFSSGTATAVHPGALALSKMMKVVSADFADNTLEQCITFIRDVSGADFEVLWTDNTGAGLEKETSITLSAKNMTLLSLLEKVLDKATGTTTTPSAATWQMTDGGSIQIGLKTSLNRFRRLESYDITDMLFEVRDKTDVPELDLQAAFQNTGGGGGGGGGGQSPFGQNNQNNQNRQADPMRRENLAKSVKDLITSLVEPDQWTDGGGDGGSITYWQGTLLINAPDYMHRQVNGYPYWGSTTAVPTARGGRYVSLDADVKRSSYDTIRNIPVPGAPGGR